MLNFVPDQYKTQEMYNKAVEGGPGMLEFIADHFTTQDMCEKAVSDYPFALLDFVLHEHKTRKI